MDEILQLFPHRIRMLFLGRPIEFEQMQEIRLRVRQPLMMIYGGSEYIISTKGGFCKHANPPYIVTENDIRETVEYISNYSLYAFEEDIKRGFLTVPGGHRVGIAGKTVVEQGRVKCIRNISFLNIRLSHEMKGCAEGCLPQIMHKDGVFHTLIVSPPMGGKTTLLRDMIRLLSNMRYHISVIDERSEIAGSYLGAPSNDLGMRTDVLDACPKALGLEMVIRSMAPDIVAVDEIGGEEDFAALRNAVNCGCVILATMHGRSMEDLLCKPFFRDAFEQKMFERFLVRGRNADKQERIWEIYDGRGQRIA
ncbi:MAG: stage III sporulation protein AA [Lachnospiraceae bacterium]|nr:stage III sporulation protein AA [Lachnospiraceae bacterium]